MASTDAADGNPSSGEEAGLGEQAARSLAPRAIAGGGCRGGSDLSSGVASRDAALLPWGMCQIGRAHV